jgi:hypothetical protein
MFGNYFCQVSYWLLKISSEKTLSEVWIIIALFSVKIFNMYGKNINQISWFYIDIDQEPLKMHQIEYEFLKVKINIDFFLFLN